MKCIYYPGCSQKASSISYEKAFIKIAKSLGIELIELEDWNCCGTTVTISVNEILALTLSARNLALAEKYNKEHGTNLPVVAPCPSCYTTLNKVNKHFNEKSKFTQKVNDALGKGGLKYEGTVEVMNILDFLVNRVGVEKIKKHVEKPLKGIRIAPYYGCQLVNPYSTGDDNFNPQNLEKLIEALGGTPVNFPYKTMCCGGSLMITRKPQAMDMSGKILKSIISAKAEMVVTPCGLCQINLDTVRHNAKIKILNVAELLNMAVGTKQLIITN